MLYLEALGIWLIQLITIVLLGTLRDLYITPLLGESLAHQLETLLACAFIFVIVLLWKKTAIINTTQAFMIGTFWLSLAITFEFGFFHYLMGIPWSKLLADYNLLAGRLLLLLWLTVFFSPLLGHYYKSRRLNDNM